MVFESHKNTCSALTAECSKVASKKCKEIREILRAPPRHWVGNGFHVFPVFHDRAFTQETSPWLMFDYAAPKDFEPSYERRGVGRHPHRGFETITIAFRGEVEHGDSCGNRDVIGPGDVQWMTAARGIVHEEFHSANFQRTGGTFEMAQLWLNLPAKHKMDAPRYQPILAKDIPIVALNATNSETVDSETNTIRVIAGDEETYGVRGAAATHTPVELLDVRIARPRVSFDVPVPEGHNTIVFVRRGGITVGEEQKPVERQGVALMHSGGEVLRLAATEQNTELLILAGEPIHEPIAARGPFVMNTHQEIMQANKDFMNGLIGQ
uniref:Pirin N-terminal domain-containing protein n=1 Tax=Corethron hystrix TaxID=216773 RepID=A0A7S1BEC4_9STRA